MREMNKPMEDLVLQRHQITPENSKGDGYKRDRNCHHCASRGRPSHTKSILQRSRSHLGLFKIGAGGSLILTTR